MSAPLDVLLDGGPAAAIPGTPSIAITNTDSRTGSCHSRVRNRPLVPVDPPKSGTNMIGALPSIRALGRR
jgi:hypothetical protein